MTNQRDTLHEIAKTLNSAAGHGLRLRPLTVEELVEAEHRQEADEPSWRPRKRGRRP